MPKLERPWHVLAVQDARAASLYFQEKLGFRETLAVGDNDWRFVARDECTLMLGTCPDDLPAQETGCHSYFAYWHVDDVDALHAEWQASGALLTSAPEDKEWGMREFTLRTPEGHRITVGQELPAS
jgi:uncharacterized glyoxalase superfamily protein PhnB